ncbi:hypothetical protein [Actinacidiphila acidipaludis]|uniref:Small acid-soluble spore protein P n=1 Tax=Actinacidiphila acidipaludis TaxID=2873382 RepID=A0ABS7Q0G4_9ACTN|nr:hypothetical protein [Streptomyces acidipaludis]MBY8876598.1 hypothetical protein [Streptomyces acidipaludis]
MAKNKNQNRQREQHDQRPNPAMEGQEPTHSATMTEEHGMPASTQVSRKQQKRFGHN